VKALSKAEREQVRMKCRGRCAYCGTVLDKNWQVDHLLPLQRISKYVPGSYRLVPTGEAHFPERHTLDNCMPSCRRCNNDKSDSSLEGWRSRLEDSHARLERNYATYYHALRFGLIRPAEPRVVFFFERPRRTLFTTN
jgi:5-methylcytosine-specific restriction endonuclease McrA